MSKLYINKHIKLKDNTVFVDNNKYYAVDKNEAFTGFIKSVYKHLNIKYPKFYKMDGLSKLGFLATELLLSGNNIKFSPEEMAIIFINSSSSLHVDIKYQKTISDMPSPSVCVYTLPNIVIGEICIRNVIRGESLFLIHDHYDTSFIYNYIHYLFENTNTKYCITGWVEITPDEKYHTELFLVSANKPAIIFNENSISIHHSDICHHKTL